MALAAVVTLVIGILVTVASPRAYADSPASIAQGQVGYYESPDGTGCNKYTYDLYGHQGTCPAGSGRLGDQYAWCSDFATWVWKQSGADISQLTPAAGSFYTYGVAHGTWHDAGSGYVPQPGDAIVYDLNKGNASASHVGIVISSGKNPPDVVQGNWGDRYYRNWGVRLDPNSAQALATKVISGYASPVGGGGGGGPQTGQILGSSCRDAHTAPDGTAPQVDCIPNGAVIAIECVKGGQNVQGPYGWETVWDRTTYNGHLEYVSDSWVFTGTDSPVAPDCGGNGVMMTPGCQNLYAAPSTSSVVTACVPQAITVGVNCTATGDTVTGPFGPSNLWDQVNYSGNGFVPDAEIYTGTDNPIAGACSSIPTSPSVTTSSLPGGMSNNAYSTALHASGGTGTYAWSSDRGSLPPGLTLSSDGTISGTPTSTGTFAFGVTVTDSYGLTGTAGEAITIASQDQTPPTVVQSGPTAVATLGSSTVVSWAGSDTGSGVARYQVRYGRAAFSGGFTGWAYPAAWQALTGTSLSPGGLAQGYDYCYSVRAIDRAGNASAWTPSRCTAVALDDRALAAATGGWTRTSSSAWWNGTATTTKTLNAALTRTSAQLDRVGVVATRCVSCGTLGLYVGSTLIGKVNLAASATAYRQLIVLPRFSYRTGTVSVKVLTSGKPIQIDGLLTSRT